MNNDIEVIKLPATEGQQPTVSNNEIIPVKRDTTGKKRGRPFGSKGSHPRRKRLTNIPVAIMTKRQKVVINAQARAKAAVATSRQADLVEKKLSILFKLSGVGEKIIASVEKKDWDKIPLKDCTSLLAVITDRLAKSGKDFDRPLINFDLGALSQILQSEREREREKVKLQAELDRLQEQAAQIGIPPSIIEAEISGE
jgi:hypothetical protein